MMVSKETLASSDYRFGIFLGPLHIILTNASGIQWYHYSNPVFKVYEIITPGDKN